MNPNLEELLLNLIQPNDSYEGYWAENAQEGVGFLQNNCRSKNIILYANHLPTVLIRSVLVPRKVINEIDVKNLGNVHLKTATSWKFEYTHNEKGLYNIELKPPLSDTVLADGEQLIFKRIFSDVNEFQPIIEINQKLIHSLDLYFMEEYHSYCRLDSQGNIEKVITIYDNKEADNSKKLCAVSILKSALETYMTLCEMALVTRFEFNRNYSSGAISDWSQQISHEIENSDLYCQSKIIPGLASYSYGCLIYHTNLTKANLIEKQKAEEDTGNKKYETFMIHDWKNKKIIETSCDPVQSANYSTQSDLPFENSPAFFKPEVLVKYKNDPEKYTITDREIYCRGTWHLNTYDINEEGQVFTYLKYLADLPYEEQQYWKSFNEMPKGGISKQAYETDFLGKFPTEENPLRELKKLVRQLNKDNPSWWTHREGELLVKVLDPSTDSITEWGNMIQALDQLIVEGFLVRGLRAVIDEKGGKYEKCWGSLKLLEVTLELYGQTQEEANCQVAPLRELHKLRTNGIAHSNPSKKKMAVSDARKKHGSLSNHFKDLVQRVYFSIKNIVEFLPPNQF